MLALSFLQRGSFLVLLENFSSGKFFEIENVRKLYSIIQLDLAESVKVKNDSLKMNDQRVW